MEKVEKNAVVQGKPPKVFTPDRLKALGDSVFALKTYRELGIRVLSLDLTPIMTGGKPKFLVDAPACFEEVPTFNRVEVRRWVGGLN